MKTVLRLLIVAGIIAIGFAAHAAAFDGGDPTPPCIPTPHNPNCNR